MIGPLFFKLPPVDIELDSMSSNHEDNVWVVLRERSWGREFRGYYKKRGLSQCFQKRCDSPKKHWDKVKIPILAFFFPALQTAGF